MKYLLATGALVAATAGAVNLEAVLENIVINVNSPASDGLQSTNSPVLQGANDQYYSSINRNAKLEVLRAELKTLVSTGKVVVPYGRATNEAFKTIGQFLPGYDEC